MSCIGSEFLPGKHHFTFPENHFTVPTYSKSDIALNNNNLRTNPATLLSIFISSTPNTKTKTAPSDHAKITPPLRPLTYKVPPSQVTYSAPQPQHSPPCPDKSNYIAIAEMIDIDNPRPTKPRQSSSIVLPHRRRVQASYIEVIATSSRVRTRRSSDGIFNRNRGGHDCRQCGHLHGDIQSQAFQAS